MYYMRKSESGLWTVGVDGTNGWEPIEDFDDHQQAMNTVHYMNGDGAADSSQSVLVEIARHLAVMNQHLANISNGLAAIHLYAAGRDEQADNFALWRTE